MNQDQFRGWLLQKSQPYSKDTFKKPLIMGVVNVTPDSFSDGGQYLSIDRAVEHALELIAQGADLIDVGGESSKPGAIPVSVEDELARVIPVIQQIRARSDVCISVDTYKPQVMQRAVDAGANVINDIYALRYEGALEMAAALGVPICLMHMQGEPQTMQNKPSYLEGVVRHVIAFFDERIKTCVQAGISKDKLILDPGFGFGKLVENNLQLMHQFEYLQKLNRPLLLGVSRKSTIGAVLNKKVNERLVGGIAIAVYIALKGVGIIRTHDVDETSQALLMIDAIYKAGQT